MRWGQAALLLQPCLFLHPFHLGAVAAFPALGPSVRTQVVLEVT